MPETMGLTDRCEPMDFRTGGMGGGEGEEEVCARGESFLRADFPRRDRAADLRVSGLEYCYSIFFILVGLMYMVKKVG